MSAGLWLALVLNVVALLALIVGLARELKK